MATSEGSGSGARPRLQRGARFVAGLVLGLLLIPILATAGLLIVLVGAGRSSASRPAQFALVTSGADISRAGGVRVVVQRFSDFTQQFCRGACDDLRLDGGEGLYSVEVRSAQDGCVVCQEARWSSAIGGRNHWSVSGRPLAMKGERAE